ncbi:hypothetical protein DXG01_013783 [Tephrocybe rancida]|nr:hypothetical protein DXG01_013783 [Tephrocybe rancida]
MMESRQYNAHFLFLLLAWLQIQNAQLAYCDTVSLGSVPDNEYENNSGSIADGVQVEPRGSREEVEQATHSENHATDGGPPSTPSSQAGVSGTEKFDNILYIDVRNYTLAIDSVIAHCSGFLQLGNPSLQFEAGWTEALTDIGQPHAQSCIKPLCDLLLKTTDTKMLLGLLGALDDILSVGETDREGTGYEVENIYALAVQEAGGMTVVRELVAHEDVEVYKKAFDIMNKYFPDEEL